MALQGPSEVLCSVRSSCCWLCFKLCNVTLSFSAVLAVSEHRRTFIVRSPFRAKHHVVVQYMTGWMKCPLPPPPPPNPPAGPPPPPDPTPPCWTPPPRRRQGGQGRIDGITGRQGTLHFSCLENCFLFQFLFLLVDFFRHLCCDFGKRCTLLCDVPLGKST